MNKRCTDSSCRRTFSTLNADGRCPHCGKFYPQLYCGRKGAFAGNRREIRLILREKDGKGCRNMNFRLDGVLNAGRRGGIILMVKAFRAQARNRGYAVGLRAAKDFCVSLTDGKEPMTDWYLAGPAGEGIRWIDPRRE